MKLKKKYFFASCASQLIMVAPVYVFLICSLIYVIEFPNYPCLRRLVLRCVTHWELRPPLYPVKFTRHGQKKEQVPVTFLPSEVKERKKERKSRGISSKGARKKSRVDRELWNCDSSSARGIAIETAWNDVGKGGAAMLRRLYPGIRQ